MFFGSLEEVEAAAAEAEAEAAAEAAVANVVKEYNNSMAKRRIKAREDAKLEYAKYNRKTYGRGGYRTRNKRKAKKTQTRTFKKVRK